MTDTERLELLAYVGNERARAQTRWPPPHYSTQEGWTELARIGASIDPDHLSLADWASVFPRWGRDVCIRAACAAARVVLGHGEVQKRSRAPVGIFHYGPAWPPRRAIEAAEAWLTEQTEERLTAWRDRVRPLIPAGVDWVPYPFLVTCDLRERSAEREWRSTICGAASLAGEQAVRDAVRAALAQWAGEGVVVKEVEMKWKARRIGGEWVDIDAGIEDDWEHSDVAEAWVAGIGEPARVEIRSPSGEERTFDVSVAFEPVFRAEEVSDG